MIEVPFRVLADGVEDFAVFTLNPEGIIQSWNPGAARMKGYTIDEAVGQPLRMLYTPESRRRLEPEKHLQVARTSGRFRGIGPRRRKSGEVFFADVLIVPFIIDGRLEGFCKLVQDLTETQRILQERDLTWIANERLEAEALYRERFVATLTHDLRSPLQAATLATALLLEHATVPGEARSAVDVLSKALERLRRMITDLLDVDRLDANGQLPLRFAPCDLRQIALDLCDEMTRHHGPRFPLIAAGPIEGNWNELALLRVLDNLLTNAVKYGAVDHPIVTTLQRLDDRVVLSVHNEGNPIPLEEQDKLFQAFHRTRAADREGKQGWGLGLSLVQGLVGAHHGSVKVESYPGSGTTFVVDLPLDAAQTAVGHIGQAEPTTQPPTTTRAPELNAARFEAPGLGGRLEVP